MRTTVLIPLHRSAEWVDVVAGNLDRLAGAARIVVSDATGEDDALDRLRARHPNGVDYLGPRDLAPGWTAHCDDLVARTTTDYLMWLPHDDEIEADWVRGGEAALDADPDAALACGPLRPLGDGHALDPDRRLAAADPVERAGAVLHLIRAEEWGAFGLLFRAVQRRRLAVPIRADADDAWADALWGIRMVLRGRVAPIEAVYGKRWYAESTHAAWGPPPDVRTAWSADLAEALAEAPTPVLARAVADAVTESFRERRRHDGEIAAARREIGDLRSSTSWRWSSPLRALGRRLRRR